MPSLLSDLFPGSFRPEPPGGSGRRPWWAAPWPVRGTVMFAGIAFAVGAGLIGWMELGAGPAWLTGAAGPAIGMGIGALVRAFVLRRAGRSAAEGAQRRGGNR